MENATDFEVILDSSSCEYSLASLDFRPPLVCADLIQCERDWPCQLREQWMDLYPFVHLTRWLLNYGTVIMILLGTVLNSLSFYVLLSSGLAKKGSGIYLGVLAICDTGNLLFNFGIGVARAQSSAINDLFMENEWLCRCHGVLVDFFQLHAAWIVVGFTMERCVVVWYPFALRESRKYRSKVVLGCSGVIFTLFALAKIFITGFEKDSVFGYAACPSGRYKWDGMVYVGIAFQTWLPTCIVFTCNCLLFWRLRAVKRNRERLTAYTRPKAQKTGQNFLYRQSATTPMLIAVSLAYLVLVFPVGIVQTTELYWNYNHRERPTSEHSYVQWMITKLLLKHIRSFCFAFYQINFCVNFFLYFASGVQFRLHLISQVQRIRSWLRIHGVNKSTERSWEMNTQASKARMIPPEPSTSSI